MATITTRAGKGSPLTNTEVDDNFSNLNSAKYESGASPTFANSALLNSATTVSFTLDGASANSKNIYFKGDSSAQMGRIASIGTSLYFQLTDATNYFTINPGSTVINDSSVDHDFRVESNDSSHMLFVEAGTNRVGINNSDPSSTLHVTGTYGDTGFIRMSGGAQEHYWYLEDALNSVFNIGTGSAAAAFDFRTNNASRFKINVATVETGNPLYVKKAGNNTSGGNIRLGTTGNNQTKWTALTATQWAYDAEPEGVSLITSSSHDVNSNNVNIGGGLDEQNAATYVGIKTAANPTTRNGTTRLGIYSNGNIVANDGGHDADFRVESNDNANMLFVDAGTNRVGIGMSAPESLLHLYETSSATGQITLSTIFNAAEHNAGRIGWTHASGWNTTIRLGTASGHTASYRDELIINRDYVVFNEDSNDTDFRVESDSSTHMLFVDAFNNHVGVDWSTPAVPLDVNGVISNRPHGSGAAYSHGLLEISSGAANPQVKITTNILWAGGTTHAHTVKISGFRYGSGQTCEVVICWHKYNNSFYQRTASSSGGFAPDITLAVENNKVVIHLGTVGYWPKLYVESMYNAYGGTGQAKGWSWSDAAISADTGTPTETVSYKTDLGGDNLIGTAGVVFNDSGQDRDFRVESDGNANMLFVDSGNNRVGIGHGTPSTLFSVQAAYAGQISNFFDTGSNGLAMHNGAAVLGVSRVSNGSTAHHGPIFEVGRDNSTSGAYNVDKSLFTVRSNETVVNEDSEDYDFRVESDGNAHMLFLDGGYNRVGIGKVPTAHALEVEGDVQMRALNTTHGLYDLIDAAPNGFPAGASADTWYEITNVDWNNYQTADSTHDHFCIALFWTSGVTNNGYNHRIRIYVPNLSSNLDPSYRGTVSTTSYATSHRDYDGSQSPIIFASHHTGVKGNGNFKFDARFNHQGSGTGQQPLRLQVKTNSPPLANTGVSMKVWRL